MINQLVDQRYEILEKIGEGPLFTVYKARDREQNSMVALKAVAGAFVRDSALLEGLERGFIAASSLNQPNITQFYGWSEGEDGAYAIVEFVRGINLRERIRRIAPFTLSVAIDVGVAVAEALQYAHGHGQTHGDLRPHNIILSPEGAVKITDFGVMAGVVQSPRAQADVLARSAPYRAPELAFTQAGSVAGDIYALGAILYEMLTGTTLYAGDSLDALADQHTFSPIPLPRVINPGVPRSVEGIIVKCLQKRSDARYRTAAEVLSDLKSVHDALRFGKPLSWSPVDVDKLANDVPPRREQGTQEEKGRKGEEEKRRGKTEAYPQSSTLNPQPTLPVAAAATSGQTEPMPSNNRLRRSDERVSVVLKIAIGIVTGVILACLIAIAGIYAEKWIEPEPVIVPKLVGRTLDEVREMARQKHLHLIEHAIYTSQPRGLVYKTDDVAGQKLKQGQDFNIWYSMGLTYVPVPNVVGLSRDEAEQKIKEAGLTVGKVTPEYSDKVPVNSIISQNVSYKKTILHDTPIGLIVSDGPKTDSGTDPGTDSNANPPASQPDSVPSNGNPTVDSEPTSYQIENPNAPDDPGNSVSHEFARTIRVQKDGKGKRKVRVEFIDANGVNPTSIDELYDEDARIPLKFTYYGKKIVLCVYYNDQMYPTKPFDPTTTQHEVVR